MGKNVLLGVCGGIACYKAVEVASRLRKKGVDVTVIMTKSATQFVTPLTFQEITGNPVSVDMWDKVQHWDVAHISLARKADFALIVPATANILGKLAAGIADDMLSTTLLAVTKAIYLAPSMNTNMYLNPIVQRNLKLLSSLPNYHIIKPASGHLACGVEGVGRLPEPAEIVEQLEKDQLAEESLAGKTVLVTAGGTREAIDPVRYIGNRSSGKMGYAIAAEAVRRGARTILVSGPVALAAPAGAEVSKIETAREMKELSERFFPQADITIMAAAVADYRVENPAPLKIKKEQEALLVHLVKNPDILAGLGKIKKEGQVLVGFAAETHDLLAFARQKLVKKNLDMIVANDVGRKDAGFNVDTNAANLISKDGKIEEIPLMSKSEMAKVILRRAEALLSK